MIEQIRTWIINPDKNYTEGVKLYLKARSDNKFDNFFQSVSNPDKNDIHFGMLIQKLSNIIRIMDAQPIKAYKTIIVDKTKAIPITVDPINLPSKKPKQLLKIDSNPYLRIEDLPDDLKGKYENVIKPLTKQIAHFHELAKIAKSDDDRKENINKAAELEAKQAEEWQILDTWYKTNVLKEVPEEQKKEVITINPAKEAVQLSARIDDLNTNINRAKKELEKLTDKKKIANRNKSISEWEKELNEKQIRLKEIIGE